jgi:hypothetical protein
MTGEIGVRGVASRPAAPFTSYRNEPATSYQTE